MLFSINFHSLTMYAHSLTLWVILKIDGNCSWLSINPGEQTEGLRLTADMNSVSKRLAFNVLFPEALTDIKVI